MSLKEPDHPPHAPAAAGWAEPKTTAVLVLADGTVPEGQGFGNAALEMTGYMRMYPATRYGVPVRGSVTMPVRFHPPGSGVPSRPASASPAR